MFVLVLVRRTDMRRLPARRITRGKALLARLVYLVTASAIV
jgi:hypothetical protein